MSYSIFSKWGTSQCASTEYRANPPPTWSYMPPFAIRSSVVVTIVMADSEPRIMRNSSALAGGNFGAPPKPPYVGSNCVASVRSASSGVPGDRSSSGARTSEIAARRATVVGAAARISSRLEVHASATPSSTWRKLGMPCLLSGGQ